MTYIVLAVARVVAVAEGSIRLFGARVKWLKRCARLIEVFVVVAVIGIAVSQLFLQAVDKIPERVQVLEQSDERQDCTIDSIRWSIEQLALTYAEDRERLGKAYSQAACVDKAGLARTLVDSAVVAMGLANYDSAVVLLEQALLNAYGDSAGVSEAYFYIGVAYSLGGDEEVAVTAFDSCTAYKRDMVAAWVNRGNSLSDLGLFEDAVASYDSAIAYTHDLAWAWCNRAHALDLLGLYEDAVASCDSAILYDRDLSIAWYNRCVVLYKLGRYADAIASCDSAIARKCRYHEAWMNRGSGFYQLRLYEHAVASYDRAIAYKHDKQEAWFSRCLALCRLEWFVEAVASCDSAIAYKRDDYEAWYRRALALGLLGRVDEAFASCDSLAKYGTDFADEAEFLGSILERLKTGDPTAVEGLRSVLRLLNMSEGFLIP